MIPASPERIFHITSEVDWDAALGAGEYRISTKGHRLETVGFIHCSFADQVETIANLIYAGDRNLVVLEIATAQIDADVVVENVEGGEQLFPHIYGPLPTSAVLAAHALHAGPDGRLFFRGTG